MSELTFKLEEPLYEVTYFKETPVKEIELFEYTLCNMLYENNGIPKGFEKLFNDPTSKSILKTIDNVFHAKGYRNITEKMHPIEKDDYESSLKKVRITCYPHLHEIFAAYHCLPLKTVEKVKIPLIKVVIIGQDPYFTYYKNMPTATGKSFSCREGHPISPSLKTIFKRLSETVEGFTIPTSGDLTYWANQGVFLLNIGLTVPDKAEYVRENPTKKDPAGALVGIWTPWAKQTINYISETNPQCVYLLWGNFARKIAGDIATSAVALEATHPSPLNNGRVTDDHFNKCDHFNQANSYLESWGFSPIDWHLDKVPRNGIWVNRK